MKKIGNLLLVLLVVGFLGVIVGYGVVASFDFSSLIDFVLELGPGTLDHLVSFVSPSLQFGLRLYIYSGALVLGLLLGVFSLVRLIKQGRLFKATLSFLSPLLVAVLGIILVAPFGASRMFATYILALVSSDLTQALLQGALVIIPVLFFGIVTLQGLFSKRIKGQRATKKPKAMVVKKTSKPTTQPLINPAPSFAEPLPTNTVSVPPLGSDLQLTELVKLVLAEELAGSRSPAFNPYASTATDLNLVRRIVAEELAKFQTHFITRAEAQTLVAQELAALKAQLKVK